MVRIARFAIVFSALCAACAAPAFANTITFTGAPAGSLGTYDVGGYEVKNLSGPWQISATVGNGSPSIVAGKNINGGTGTSSFQITSPGVAGATFDLFSFDILNVGSGSSAYTLTGFLAGSTVFTFTGTDSVSGWQTITLPAIDQTYVTRITFSLVNGGNSSTGYALDNFVTVSPEPSSLILFATGILGLAVVARRRRFLA
jgi:hypothetical protein